MSIARSRRALSVAVAAVLSGCATAGQIESLANSGDRQPAPKVDDRTARIAIAQMLEGHFAYRGILESGAPKLHSARIVGPFETKPLLSSQTLINYCVEAEIGKQLFPMVRQALVVIQHDRQGKIQVNATIGMSRPVVGCVWSPATPFPALERARELRRQALGMSA